MIHIQIPKPALRLAGGTPEEWRLFRHALQEHFQRPIVQDTGPGSFTFDSALREMHKAHAKLISDAS